MTDAVMKKTFSKRLTTLIDLICNRSISKDDIARATGISRAALVDYLHGYSLPNTLNLIKLADFFCVSIDYLLGRVDLNTEMYKIEIRSVVEGSYEKYLGTVRTNPTESMLNYINTNPQSNGYVCPVWPYNLLDVIQSSPRIDDERRIDYPITPEQREGLGFVIDTGLTTREQLCIQDYFKNELTLEECGNRHGVTRERIRQVLAKAVRKLRHPSRFNIIRYGIDILETNAKQQEINVLKARLDGEILELNKKIVEVEAKNAISKDDMMDVLDITKEQVEEARQNVYTTPLIELDLSIRSYNCLIRAGCKSMADVIPKIEDDSIIRIRNLGRKSAKEIANKLLELGYCSEKCQEYARL